MMRRAPPAALIGGINHCSALLPGCGKAVDLQEQYFRGVWAAHFYGTGVLRASWPLYCALCQQREELSGLSSDRKLIFGELHSLSPAVNDKNYNRGGTMLRVGLWMGGTVSG